MFLSYAACHASLRSPCFVSSELCCFFCWISCLCFLKAIHTAARFIKILLLKILCCLGLPLVPNLCVCVCVCVCVNPVFMKHGGCKGGHARTGLGYCVREDKGGRGRERGRERELCVCERVVCVRE